MSNGKPVRLGVAGLGNFGSLHAQTIAKLAECELAVIVDRDEPTLAAAKNRWRDAASYADIQQAIDNAAVDGWIIATTSTTHVPIARQFLAAGGCVLIEKPLAESVEDAESLADLVKPNSSNVMLGHIVLFGSEFRALVRQAQDRSPIQFIDAVRHRPQTTLDLFPGESPFHLTMVHDLYCVQVLKQREEPISVSAQMHRDEEGRVDLALAQLKWQDGSMASLTASFLTPAGMPADGFDRMEVFGRDWTARVNSNPRPLELWDDVAHAPVTLEMDDDWATGMLAEELRCFCRVLRGESDVPMGAAYSDAIQVQRWLEKLSSVVT